MTDYYTLIHDPEDLVLAVFRIGTNTHGQVWSKPYAVRIYKMMASLCDPSSEIDTFEFAVLIVLKNQRAMQQLITRLKSHRTHNIENTTPPCRQYLLYGINDFIDWEKKSKTMADSIDFEGITQKVNQAFESIKHEAGLPISDELDFSYKVTDEVISQAKTPDCIKYLERYKHKQYIFKSAFEAIYDSLDKKYPDDMKKVISALKETESREHLSAVSIAEYQGRHFVCIANEEKRYIKMESFKFLQLIESGESLRLHTFEKTRYKEDFDEFELSGITEGTVLGKFYPDRCYLQTVKVDDNNKVNGDRALFIIESNYLLCLYLTLKRIKDDHVRFAERMNEATTLMPTIDPFEQLVEII